MCGPQIETLSRLDGLLERVLTLLDTEGHEHESDTETFLKTLETINMFDKYFTPEQQQRLRDHQARGTETVAPVIQELQKAFDAGLAPASPQARTLMQRFHEAIEGVTNGDQQMTGSIKKLLHDEEQARKDHGISEALFGFMAAIDPGHG